MGEPERDALVFDVVRTAGYATRAAATAERVGAGELVRAELADVVRRLQQLHSVALVSAGWCASERCGADLTDPAASPSGARHCRACRVGWVLVEVDGRLRAQARPWPTDGA